MLFVVWMRGKVNRMLSVAKLDYTKNVFAVERSETIKNSLSMIAKRRSF